MSTTFAFYERDLDALQQQVLQFLCPQPWFAIGHSMGGAILLAQAHAGRSPFARMVLSAPMIDLHGLRFPRVVRAIAEALDMVGLGTAYVPGGSRAATLERGFEGNVLTSDPVRFARCAGIHRRGAAARPWRSDRGLAELGVPADGRIHRCRISAAHLHADACLGAGEDRVVSVAATERFATRLKVGRLIVIPDSRHEILMERDSVRAQFWAAFDAFIPGQHMSVPAFEAAAEAKRAARSRRRAGFGGGRRRRV